MNRPIVINVTKVKKESVIKSFDKGFLTCEKKWRAKIKLFYNYVRKEGLLGRTQREIVLRQAKNILGEVE